MTGRRRRDPLALDRLVNQPAAEQDVSRWAVVTQVSPLRIKLDGESTALPFTPDSLVGGLGLGARVRVLLLSNDNPSRSARRVVILGVAAAEFVSRVITEVNNNSTTLTNDGVLFFTPPIAGTYWDIEIWGAYSTPAGQNFKCSFDVNAGAGNGMRWSIVAPSLADVTKPPFDYRFDNSVESLGRAGTYSPFWIKGSYHANTTATLHFQWAQDTAGAGPTFVLHETFLRARMTP